MPLLPMSAAVVGWGAGFKKQSVLLEQLSIFAGKAASVGIL